MNVRDLLLGCLFFGLAACGGIEEPLGHSEDAATAVLMCIRGNTLIASQPISGDRLVDRQFCEDCYASGDRRKITIHCVAGSTAVGRPGGPTSPVTSAPSTEPAGW
jgi:hypothetical protein